MAGTRADPEVEYRGYSNSIPPLLVSPSEKFSVPNDCYFALGDNSYNSSDSRAWGTVPQDNLMGPGFLVYWPFLNNSKSGTHFGLIR